MPLRAARSVVGRGRRRPAPAVVPPDPLAVARRAARPGPRPAARAALLPHRRRLWLRRLVRRGWIALAAVVVAELVLWTLARFVPLRARPARRRGDPARRSARLAGRRACAPDHALGETALARRCRGRARRPGLECARAGRRVPGLGRPGAGRCRRRCRGRRPARRGRRDRPVRPPAAPRRPALDRHDARRPVPATLLAPAGDGRRWWRPCCSCPVTAAPEPAGRRDRPAAAGPRGRRTTGGEDRSRRRGARPTRAATPTIRGRGWPRSCATSRASCASARTTSTPTSPGSARSRPTSAPRSTRPTSSARRRSRRSAGRCRAPRPASPTRTATAIPRRRSDDLKDLGDKLDELTPEQQTRARPPAGRARGDGLAGRRRRRDRAERRRPEPGAGRHGRGAIGARSAR